MIHDDSQATWDQDDVTQVRDALHQHPLRSDSNYRRLLEAVTNKVRKTEPNKQHWRINEGFEVVEAILRAVNEEGLTLLDEHHADTHKKFWHHKNRIWLSGKKRSEPYISLADTQEAAAIYLQLPYRVPAIDRILVDMLIGAEMFAFADEMQPVLSRKVPLLLEWLLVTLRNSIVGCIIAGICFWIDDGGSVGKWVGGIILALTLLATLGSLVIFPFYYPSLRAHHRNTKDAAGAMLDAYAALEGYPASTRHVEEMLKKATDKGVVWPSQLFVLMDDIRLRSLSI